MPSNYLILCHPLLLLPSILPWIEVFSKESVLCIRWPKYWSFSFNISPSNEYSGLISYRMHWLDLLAVQGTLKSLLQYYSSKTSVLRCSAFFIVQLSYSYMTTWKTIALTRQTFAGKVMSLLFMVSTVAQWSRICLQWRKHKFNPWIGKIPWRRKWLSTPVFLPGKSHGQRSLVDYSSWGHRGVICEHGWAHLNNITLQSLESPSEGNSAVQFQISCSVMSDSLWPHESQDARPPCLSPTPGVYPNPCTLSRWCHPTISSSGIHFSSCLQSFPASGSFQMSQLFASGVQSIGISASTSVLPMNIQDWSPLGRTRWISLQSKGLSRVFSNTTVQKHQFFGAQLSL